jgi:Domain of unknown function (DUF6457)
VNTLEEWAGAVCGELGLDPASLDVPVILDMARDVAHGVARPAAPLTAYLLGVAVGQGRPLAGSAARISQLAASRTGPSTIRPRPATNPLIRSMNR